MLAWVTPGPLEILIIAVMWLGGIALLIAGICTKKVALWVTGIVLLAVPVLLVAFATAVYFLVGR